MASGTRWGLCQRISIAFVRGKNEVDQGYMGGNREIGVVSKSLEEWNIGGMQPERTKISRAWPEPGSVVDDNKAHTNMQVQMEDVKSLEVSDQKSH
ncbi:hypothetical protein AnigIFM59636_003767 [Aspergillus niger]|nr:hypothetical protein AnigIFM59636_003767 [Aspergillus niger]